MSEPSCLNCRKLHYKCTKDLPKCRRCVLKGIDCSYVKSKRGGARKKGVKNTPATFSDITPEESPYSESDTNDDIIDNYYTSFHNSHPFLPSRGEIHSYLDNLNRNYDLIGAMKIISDNQKHQDLYKKPGYIEEVAGSTEKLLKYIGEYEMDLVSLQSLILLSISCHLCGLRELGDQIRATMVRLCQGGSLSFFDASQLPSTYTDITQKEVNTKDFTVESNFLISSRFIDPQFPLWRDCVRRTFWETLYQDVLMGVIDGKDYSALVDGPCLIKTPQTPSRNEFDYQGRAESCILLDSVKRLNAAILDRDSSAQSLTIKLKAKIGSWDMRTGSPEMFSSPLLVNVNGKVNDGVHQAVTMYVYAKILYHRPLSCIHAPVHKGAMPSCAPANPSVMKDLIQELYGSVDISRKVIETRKCINSANLLITSLVDTDAALVEKRSPVICCSFVFSSFVHLSAYLWIQTGLENNNLAGSQFSHDFSTDELGLIEELMKIELSALYKMGTHWCLPGKLYTFVLEVMQKRAAGLFEKLRPYLPLHTERIEPEDTQPTEEYFLEMWKSFEDIDDFLGLFDGFDANQMEMPMAE